MLRLRLIDIPGWTATIDGHPLKLSRFLGIMLQARIPPGIHTIELTYWPTAFTIGLVVAGLTIGTFLSVFVLLRVRRRRDQTTTD